MPKDASEQVKRAFANLEHGDEFTAADLRAILDDHARLTAECDALRKEWLETGRVLSQRTLRAAKAEAERDALRAYAREAIIHASNNLSTHLEQYHDHEEETPERSNLRGIMHHLEGTLMAMDDTPDEAG